VSYLISGKAGEGGGADSADVGSGEHLDLGGAECCYLSGAERGYLIRGEAGDGGGADGFDLGPYGFGLDGGGKCCHLGSIEPATSAMVKPETLAVVMAAISSAVRPERAAVAIAAIWAVVETSAPRPDAEVAAGEMLFNGRGGPPDKETAMALFRRAASADHAGGLFALKVLGDDSKRPGTSPA
jgi:TPR repeat protein